MGRSYAAVCQDLERWRGRGVAGLADAPAIDHPKGLTHEKLQEGSNERWKRYYNRCVTQYWLLKTEPDVFSFGDLMEEPEGAMWEGVRNYQARNLLREVKAGDKVLIYHSNCKPPGVVGVAEASREAYPDPTQFIEESPYYDEKSSRDEPRWTAVDVKGLYPLKRFVTLGEIKEEPALSEMKLVQRGNRLSVMRVTETEFSRILALGETRD